jgi:hypothetical protein
VDGYVFPLNIRDELPYLGMRPYTNVEYESLPQVILISDVDWNPRVLDFDIDDPATIGMMQARITCIILNFLMSSAIIQDIYQT